MIKIRAETPLLSPREGQGWVMKEIARKLRRNQTPQEKIMWEQLRNRRLDGKKFIRQYVINYILDGKERFFVADFYCAEKKLVVEIDGAYHDDRKEYDSFRDSIIKEKGMRVVRFTNTEVENNLQDVLEKIVKH